MVARCTNRVVAASTPALLFELRQQFLVRQRFENQRQVPEVRQLIDIDPGKECSVGTSQCCGSAAGNAARGAPARFFARRDRSPQGAASGRRALGWNLRKSQSRRSGFAVFHARAKEIPRPRKLSPFQDVTNSACGSELVQLQVFGSGLLLSPRAGAAVRPRHREPVQNGEEHCAVEAVARSASGLRITSLHPVSRHNRSKISDGAA